MDKIIEQTADWPYLQQMPVKHAGFELIQLKEVQGSQYLLFAYEYPDARKKFTILYDKATKDYLALINLGLFEYYDISFITTDLNTLEKLLKERLLRTLSILADPSSENYESIFRKKNILQVPATTELPSQLAGFELFINPKKPVKIINGSYIILDYSDFSTASNLVIYYNIFRDEFFGEIRLRQTPRMINQFDAKELPDLIDKIKLNLSPTLYALRDEINGNTN